MKTFKINLGRGLDVDVLKLVETRVGICTNSGGGKSHLMRLMAERIGRRLPIHIIDWEGEWYTLRPKIDAVLVAKGGDLTPQVHTAGKLAQRLIEKHVSAILDVSSLSRLNRLLFVASYIEALMDAPAKHRHPMLVFIDEAHRMAPEIASKGGGKELLSAVQRSRSAVISLMDSGRKRAIGGVLATQRLSKVSKDAIGEANNIFIGRYAQDTDLKRVGELLGLDRANRDAPKTFKAGEFFAQGPALSKAGTTKFRSALTETKAPKFGATPSAAAPSKTMSKILADLASIPEEVELEAKNFKEAKAELRKAEAQIKRLTRENQLARKGKMSAAQKGTIIHEAMEKLVPEIEKRAKMMEKAALEVVKDERTWWKANLKLFMMRLDRVFVLSPLDVGTNATDLRAAVHVQLEVLESHAADKEPFIIDIQKVVYPKASEFRRDMTPEEVDEVMGSKPVPMKHRGDGDMRQGKFPFSWSSAPGKVLTVLVQNYPELLDMRRLAALAGVSPRSSTFRNAISKLRTLGFATNGERGSIRASADAQHFASEVPALPSGPGLINQWRGRLGSGVLRRVFDALIEGGGKCSKEEVAAASDTDASSSTFRNAISKLRTLGLVEPGYPVTAAPHVQEAMT